MDMNREPNMHVLVSESYTNVPMHSIALLLAVFATGSAGDLTLPQYNEEAETFYHLALAALNFKNVFNGDPQDPGVTLETVQAVSLLGSYHMFSARKESTDACALIMNLAHCLAASVSTIVLSIRGEHFMLTCPLTDWSA